MQTVTLRDLAPFNGEQFIEQCYLKLLSREPDSEGKQHYRSMLESGKSKVAIIRSILKSKEARKLGVRVDGLWLKAISETTTQLPVFGGLYSAVRILFTASSTLREISASRELALSSQRKIQALEKLMERQRDLDPVFNSVASNHHYMREVQRRLSLLEASPLNADALDPRVDALEREIASLANSVQEMPRTLDSFANMVASVPAALRDHSIKLATIRQRVGEQGAPDWASSLEGRLEQALAAIGRQEDGLAKLATDMPGNEPAVLDNSFERLNHYLTLLHAVESRIEAMSLRLADQAQRAGLDTQRIDRSIESMAAHSARMDVVCEAIEALRVSHTQIIESVESERVERYQLTSRFNYAVESAAAQRDDLEVLRRSLVDEQAERIEQSSALAACTQKLRDEIGGLGRDIGQIHTSLDAAYNRIEFSRKEALFEMKYGAAGAFAKAPEVAARIVNVQRVDVARAGILKLNVGCGHLPIDDYINIDRREVVGIDVIAEATKIPFARHEVSVIRAAHLIEHFPQEQLRREVLPHWRHLLKERGKLNLIVPDVEHMFTEYYRGTYPYENFREVLFGGQEYGGDFHYNMFMPSQLAMLLSEAGFKTVRWLARGRVNGQCFEMELEAE
ncbi:DUF4214 domain-containing protein [Paraburkholderia haematera]|uniref:DUF4214 domain-containing protein n=1 Tax=Paraburkholderia haematera TaxID=2793077 RepID=A0ABM8QWA8_9BURK|nr:DUF4214 domain-containing protein [Paraburkholderia haematera]CAE6718994.1 hypothetical protein R69888_01504 [Paraburkholderia haematera]